MRTPHPTPTCTGTPWTSMVVWGMLHSEGLQPCVCRANPRTASGSLKYIPCPSLYSGLPLEVRVLPAAASTVSSIIVDSS